jgi:hypothetical protein
VILHAMAAQLALRGVMSLLLPQSIQPVPVRVNSPDLDVGGRSLSTVQGLAAPRRQG